MSTAQQETYADKIRKLLLKAESTTPGEAELLYAKAQELMEKYSIDEAMLAAAGQDIGDNPIVDEEFVVVGIYRFALTNVAVVALRAAGLEVYKLGGKNPRVFDGRVYQETVVLKGFGYKKDVDRARILQTSLMLQAMRAENAWWQQNDYRYDHLKPKEQHYQRRQFLFSFAQGIQSKLDEANERARKAAEEQHGTESVALVLRDKSLALNAEFHKRNPNLRSSRSKMRGGSNDAHHAGEAAGRRADTGGTSVGGGRKSLGS